MAATVRNLRRANAKKTKKAQDNKKKIKNKEVKMSTNEDSGNKGTEETASAPANDFMDFNDLDFVDHYGEDKVTDDSLLLPGNTATTAINCGFVGLGGGGGKLAKAFLDLGYNKTVLVVWSAECDSRLCRKLTKARLWHTLVNNKSCSACALFNALSAFV